MAYYERSIDISAPPERVWQVMVDVERWHEWTDSIRSLVRQDEGEFGVGSAARVAVRGGPASTWRVTDLQPGRSFVWESKTFGAVATAGHEIEPREGGSRVRLWVRNRGPLAFLLTPYLAMVARRNVTMEAEGLKRRAEEGA